MTFYIDKKEVGGFGAVAQTDAFKGATQYIETKVNMFGDHHKVQDIFGKMTLREGAVVKVESDKEHIVTVYESIEPNLYIVPLLRTSEGVYAMVENRFPEEAGGFVYPGLIEEKSIAPRKAVTYLNKGGEFSVSVNKAQAGKADELGVKVSCKKDGKPQAKLAATFSKVQTAAEKQLFLLDIDLSKLTKEQALKKLGWKDEGSAFTVVPLNAKFVEENGIPSSCKGITESLSNYLNNNATKKEERRGYLLVALLAGAAFAVGLTVAKSEGLV